MIILLMLYSAVKSMEKVPTYGLSMIIGALWQVRSLFGTNTPRYVTSGVSLNDVLVESSGLFGRRL